MPMSNQQWEATDEHGQAAAPQRGGRSGLLFWVVLAALAGGLFFLLLFMGNGHGRAVRAGRTHSSVGQPLSNLELAPLTGTKKPLTLTDLKGKVALINYWGTWCGPCQMELPGLLTLERSLRTSPDFVFVSVSCGNGATSESRGELEGPTAANLSALKTDIPTYFDEGLVSRRALVSTAKLDSFGYPTTVLLDREGKIRALWIAYHPAFELEMDEAVHEVLAEK